jgi:hypothetical protein
LTRSRYILITTDATTSTTKKTHPRVQVHVPAGANKHRKKISKDETLLAINRRRSMGSVG